MPIRTGGKPDGMMGALLTLGQLRAFVTVADAGGFSAAAKRLGLGQSTVSEAVRELEAALGAGPLLLRRPPGGGSGGPTAAGRAVLPEAHAALEAVARLQRRAAEQTGLDKTTLRIAAVGSASARLLPIPLRQFRAAYPGIAVALFEGTDAEVREWVLGGVANLGVATATDRPSEAPPTGLRTELLIEDEMLAVFAAGHRGLARLATVPAAALTTQPFLMSAAGCEAAIVTFFEAAGHAPPVAATVRDMPTLLAMVREAIGATVVPSLVLSGSGEPPPGLRARPLDPPLRRRLCLLRRQGQQSTAADAFVAMLRAATRQGPGSGRT